MAKIRMGLLSLIAVLAISAMVSASALASGHVWKLNGTTVETVLPVNSTGGAFTLNKGGTQEVKCTNVTDKGYVTANGKDEATEIMFTGCTTNEMLCKVKSAGPPATAGNILVTSIKTLLTTREKSGGGTVLADEFEQKANGEFVTLEFGKKELSNNTMTENCANFPHSTKAEGEVAAIVENNSEALVFPEPELKGNSLKVFGKAAKLTGVTFQKEIKGGKLTGV